VSAVAADGNDERRVRGQSNVAVVCQLQLARCECEQFDRLAVRDDAVDERVLGAPSVHERCRALGAILFAVLARGRRVRGRSGHVAHARLRRRERAVPRPQRHRGEAVRQRRVSASGRDSRFDGHAPGGARHVRAHVDARLRQVHERHGVRRAAARARRRLSLDGNEPVQAVLHHVRRAATAHGGQLDRPLPDRPTSSR
jgi:hypothetical protein